MNAGKPKFMPAMRGQIQQRVNFMKTSFLILAILSGLLTSIHAQSGANYIQFGKLVIDASIPTELANLDGKIRSIEKGIVTLDIYKIEIHSLPASGNAGIGAYSAGGSGYVVKEFDRTVAITNLPDFKNATIDKEVTVRALQIGTLKVRNQPLEFYDCGVLYVPPPLTPEQIAAAKVAKEKAKADAKVKAEKSVEIALKSNQDAAARGDAYGLLRMGQRYRDGDGVEKDLAKAKQYLQKAADAGSPTAAEELSKLKQ